MKQGLMVILKFFGFLLILPLIIAVVLAFQNQILGVPADKEQWFLWGAVLFILFYVFLYPFKEVYTFGQNIVTSLLKFLGPVGTAAGLVVPIYTILLICVFLLVHIIDTSARYENYIICALGFSVALHIVLTANQLYEADSSSIKSEYLFGFGIALVFILLILSLLLGLAIPEYSLVEFFKIFWNHTSTYYQAIYKVLFVSPT